MLGQDHAEAIALPRAIMSMSQPAGWLTVQLWFEASSIYISHSTSSLNIMKQELCQHCVLL